MNLEIKDLLSVMSLQNPPKNKPASDDLLAEEDTSAIFYSKH
jgi:hypothetical protein